MLSGGVANLGNISKFMSSEFKVPVEIANPFAFLPERGNVPKDVLPSLAVAAGLALRKLKDWD
jgi:Tfp pilus assembly PilM family ATPase